MSNEYDYNEEDDNTGNGMKELRSLVKKLQNENKELSTSLESFTVKERQQTVAQFLTSKGISADVAEFVPVDVQNEEALNSWLETKGKLFGYNPESAATNAQNDSKPVAPNNGLNNLQSLGATPDVISDINSRISNASTKAELAEALASLHKTIIK